MIQKTGIFSILIIYLMSPGATAQTPIGLDEAISLAYKNNGYVQNRRLIADYRKQLINTAGEIPAMGIYADAGQINSIYFDTRVGLDQGIVPGKVYSTQKNVYEKEFQEAQFEVDLKKREIRRAVEGAFSDYRYHHANLEILAHMDSLFASSLKRMQLRQQRGEDNIIDLSQAEINHNKTSLLLMQYQVAKTAAVNQLGLLLNTKEFIPVVAGSGESIKPPPAATGRQHPLLLTLQSQREIAVANQQLEKARMLPTYKVGYFNSSFRGTGPDGKIYKAADRMHGGNIALQLPLFRKAGKEKIKAFQLQEKIAVAQYDWQAGQLHGQVNILLEKYAALNKMLENYSTKGRPNMAQVVDAAARQLDAGEINYMQWTILMNSVLENEKIKNDIIRQMDEVSIELNYLTQE